MWQIIRFLSLSFCICWTLFLSAQTQYTEKELAVIHKLDSIKPLIGGRTDSAITLLDEAIEYYQLTNDSFSLGRTISLKFWAFMFTGQYEEGLELGHKAHQIQETQKDSIGIALTLNRIGLLNLKFARYDEAIAYMNQSLNLFVLFNDTQHIDMIYNNLGTVYSDQHKSDSAILFFKKSLKLRKQFARPYWLAYQYFNIGESYGDLENYDSATVYLNKAEYTFLHKSKKKKIPPMVLLGIGELHMNKGNRELGFDYLERGLAKSIEWQQKALILEGRKLLAKRYYQNKQFQKAYEMHDEWQQLKAQLDSTNRATRIAEMEDKFQTAQKEKEIAQLSTEKLKAEKRAQFANILIVAFFILVTLIALAIWWIYQRNKNRQKIKEADLNARLSEVKLQALKSQMNPHFVFNCINTTQHFVMHSQQVEAYEYLSKFARLLRMVLENSDATFIPLEDEIEQIRLYLELESIRFNNHFNFTIELDEPLQNGVYLIPGMMLQPLIENAVLHGLVNRTEPGGKLTITFSLVSDCIKCIITDNGIGRDAAMKIKANKAIHYQSKALPNIQSRIQILQEEMQHELALNITDLYENDKAAGTRVSILFPFK